MGLTFWERIRLALFAHPMQLSVTLVFAILGLSLLIGGPAPMSVDAVLPGYAVTAWGLSLTVGGVTTFLGLLLTRWLVELAGLCVVIPAIVVYAVIIIAYQGHRGALPAAIFIAIGLGLVGRVAQEWKLERFEALYRFYLAEIRTRRRAPRDG